MSSRHQKKSPGLCAIWLVAYLGAGTACGSDRGESCIQSKDCKSGLVCHQYKCKGKDEAALQDEMEAQRLAAAQEQEVMRRRKQELQMLEASGIDQPTAEQPAADDGLGEDGVAAAGTVRVSHTSGQSPVFAACRSDERLIGGGCHPPSTSVVVQSSYPSGFDARDTVGARWNCVGGSDYVGMDLEAFALCLRLTDAQSTTGPGQP